MRIKEGERLVLFSLWPLIRVSVCLSFHFYFSPHTVKAGCVYSALRFFVACRFGSGTLDQVYAENLTRLQMVSAQISSIQDGVFKPAQNAEEGEREKEREKERTPKTSVPT